MQSSTFTALRGLVRDPARGSLLQRSVRSVPVGVSITQIEKLTSEQCRPSSIKTADYVTTRDYDTARF